MSGRSAARWRACLGRISTDSNVSNNPLASSVFPSTWGTCFSLKANPNDAKNIGYWDSSAPRLRLPDSLRYISRRCSRNMRRFVLQNRLPIAPLQPATRLPGIRAVARLTGAQRTDEGVPVEHRHINRVRYQRRTQRRHRAFVREICALARWPIPQIVLRSRTSESLGKIPKASHLGARLALEQPT